MLNPLDFLRSPFDEEGGGASVAEVSAPEPAAIEAPAVEAAPTSMQQAIERAFKRDEVGRFATEDRAVITTTSKPAEVAPVVAPVVEPEAEEDPTKMPEGLGPKAQERFQKLANSVKERDEQIGSLSEQVRYVKETFQQHAVKPEQFEQAVGVIGAINRGDFQGALKIIDQQRQYIALAMGQALPGSDPLAGFTDLRERVDGLQISEQDAIRLAQLQSQEQARTQRAQQEAMQQQQTQAHQAQVLDAQGKVEDFCKRMQSSDLDYKAIEAQLVPELGNLLQGVPPAAWARIVETQYRLLKQTAGAARVRSTQQQNPLRPTGTASPSAVPRSGYEAMWGKPQPM